MPSPGRARSSAQRNAASVFPDPVGAWMSTWLPEAMAGQPCSCAGVGPAKVRSNQPRTSWLKGASALIRPAYPSGVGLRLRRAAPPWLLRGTPSHHPLSSLAPKGAPVARASCRDRHDLCRTWRPARGWRPRLESTHGRDPPHAPLLHGRRRGRPLPGRGAAGTAGRVRPRPAGDSAEGLLRPARDPAQARHVRRRGHRRDRPGRAGGDLPAEAGHPPLPGEHGRARAGALRRGRRGLRRTRRARLARRRERRGPRAPPARTPRDRPDEGAVAARDPGQALRRAAAGLGGRRADAPHARRRRFLRSARGLPGEEARPQGGHARRRNRAASRRRRGARPAPRAPSRARSRGAGSPACPRRSA